MSYLYATTAHGDLINSESFSATTKIQQSLDAVYDNIIAKKII